MRGGDAGLIRLGAQIIDNSLKWGWDEEHGRMLYFRNVHRLPCTESWHDMKLVVLAHVARSFCRHYAYEGLERVVDCGNIWLDTSAITDSETFVSALRVFGAQRILFGTDYPVSHFRGRCVTAGRGLRWDLQERGQPSAGFHPVGLESLHALRQAMEETGATASEVEAVFYGNAQGLLPEG